MSQETALRLTPNTETKEARIGKIVSYFFMSLDGVVEAPDQWHFPYFDDEMGNAVGKGFETTDAMLMGRVLYDEWASYWPTSEDEPIASIFNNMPKYVVSGTLKEATWNNTTIISGDVAAGIRDFAFRLAAATADVLDGGQVPVILGGDCSIVLGPLLALRRRGRYGLLFVDGHADFYQPAADPRGEVASMDLALATGRGPSVLSDLDGLSPLVTDTDVVQLGRRDADVAAADGSQRIEDTDILVIGFADVQRLGVDQATRAALGHLNRVDLDGVWVHIDCDVLDDDLMPAVDYRLPGGLGWDELEHVLRSAFDTGRVVGIDVTIFNPTLDRDGSIAELLVECLARGMSRPS